MPVLSVPSARRLHVWGAAAAVLLAALGAPGLSGIAAAQSAPPPLPPVAPAAPAAPLPPKPATPPEKAEKPVTAEEKDAARDALLVNRCKERALAALKRRSPSVEDIFIDMDGLTIARAQALTVGETKIEAVLMGEAYIQRDRSDKVHRFLCLTGPDDAVLLTFFTEQ